jgi:metal-sulfur cluster biosynthetic enzyme
MVNNFSEEYIRREIGNVVHPTIHCSLVELGIVKNIQIKPGKVIITMALPFADVPDSIKDYLVDSLRVSIEEVDAPVEIETVIMNKEELEKFVLLEKEKGKSQH